MVDAIAPETASSLIRTLTQLAEAFHGHSQTDANRRQSSRAKVNRQMPNRA
jgi:hypothetical protein